MRSGLRRSPLGALPRWFAERSSETHDILLGIWFPLVSGASSGGGRRRFHVDSTGNVGYVLLRDYLRSSDDKILYVPVI
jgi:hypothetical protein